MFFLQSFYRILLATIFSVEFDTNIIRQHFSTSFFANIFRQDSTLFDTIRQYFLSKFVEAEFDNIFRQTLFDNIFRQNRSTTFLDKHYSTAYFVDAV